MKIVTQAIPLPPTTTDDRLVKRGALLAFRALRAVTEQTRKAPGFIAQTTADIADAWRESASPNVGRS